MAIVGSFFGGFFLLMFSSLVLIKPATLPLRIVELIVASSYFTRPFALFSLWCSARVSSFEFQHPLWAVGLQWALPIALFFASTNAWSLSLCFLLTPVRTVAVAIVATIASDVLSDDSQLPILVQSSFHTLYKIGAAIVVAHFHVGVWWLAPLIELSAFSSFGFTLFAIEGEQAIGSPLNSLWMLVLGLSALVLSSFPTPTHGMPSYHSFSRGKVSSLSSSRSPLSLVLSDSGLWPRSAGSAMRQAGS